MTLVVCLIACKIFYECAVRSGSKIPAHFPFYTGKLSYFCSLWGYLYVSHTKCILIFIYFSILGGTECVVLSDRIINFNHEIISFL